MGITGKISQMFSSLQSGAKNSSIAVFNITVKLVTVFFIGLTLAMIGQELMAYGTISMMFVMLVVMAALLKIMANWSTGALLIFDLICILVGLLLRMYIVVAP